MPHLQRIQRVQEIEEEKNRKQQAERGLGSALQQVGTVQGLVARNLYSKVDFPDQ